MDDGLAAGDVGKRGFAVLVALRDGGQEAARVARGAAQARRQDDGCVAERPGRLLGGGAELADAAGDVGLDVRERLRRLLRQKLQRTVGEPQAVFSHHLQRLCAGRRIGIGRAGGDHIQRIAQNVGQHDGEDLRGQAALGEPAALDRGEALAQRVHLHDVRAAGEQLLRDVRHLLRGDQRTFKQSRAAAREQEQHGIPLAQPADELQCAARGAVGILIRHGVARLEQLQRADGALDMVVFCDDCPAGDRRAQHVIGGLGHLPGGLTGSDQDEPALRLLKLLQRAAHGGIRQRVGQRLVDDGLRVLSESLHDSSSFAWGHSISCPHYKKHPGKKQGRKGLKSGLRQACTIRQADSARDFPSSQDLKSAGILYVFQAFQTAGLAEKIRRSARTQLCRVASTQG